jgi:hypothetical protein
MPRVLNMKNSIYMVVKVGMILYLALLFGIVEPNHHHLDNDEHADCVICMLAHQPAQTTVIFTVQIIGLLLFIYLVAPAVPLSRQAYTSFKSRAPPLF